MHSNEQNQLPDAILQGRTVLDEGHSLQTVLCPSVLLKPKDCPNTI